MGKKIAIPVNEAGSLDAHFGHCKFFRLIELEGSQVISEEDIIPPPHEPGVLPVFLAEKGVTDIIAGGMGQKAIQIFNKHKVNVFVGAPQKTATDLVDGLLNNTIEFTTNYCDH